MRGRKEGCEGEEREHTGGILRRHKENWKREEGRE